MDKTIVTAFMTVAALLCAVLLFRAMYPAVISAGDAMVSMERRMGNRLRSEIGLIHTAGELDENQLWQDTNGNGMFDVFVWVKNLGTLRIDAIESGDVFFGPAGQFVRIPHQSAATGSYPYWTWELENCSRWDPTCTLKITLHFASILNPGRYYIKVVLPNGVSDELYFSM